MGAVFISLSYRLWLLTSLPPHPVGGGGCGDYGGKSQMRLIRHGTRGGRGAVCMADWLKVAEREGVEGDVAVAF